MHLRVVRLTGGKGESLVILWCCLAILHAAYDSTADYTIPTQRLLPLIINLYFVCTRRRLCHLPSNGESTGLVAVPFIRRWNSVITAC
jgi:hypothetical protein